MKPKILLLFLLLAGTCLYAIEPEGNLYLTPQRWVNREERMGEKNGLNFFQRKMAYGYKVVAEGKNSSTVTLTAYSGKKLTICQRGNHYVCETMIGGKKAVLKYLYVKVSDHNPMGVDYQSLMI